MPSGQVVSIAAAYLKPAAAPPLQISWLDALESNGVAK